MDAATASSTPRTHTPRTRQHTRRQLHTRECLAPLALPRVLRLFVARRERGLAIVRVHADVVAQLSIEPHAVLIKVRLPRRVTSFVSNRTRGTREPVPSLLSFLFCNSCSIAAMYIMIISVCDDSGDDPI